MALADGKVTTPENTALNGVNGQLVTIRSSVENAYIVASCRYPWCKYLDGCTDANVEGEWRWIDSGSEADQFWSGEDADDYVNDAYHNWVSGSTRSSGGEEDGPFDAPPEISFGTTDAEHGASLRGRMGRR